MVICLDRGADLHMTHLMPLPLTVKSRLVLPFWYRLTWVVPAVKRVCVCVRACVRMCVRTLNYLFIEVKVIVFLCSR